MSRSSRLAVVAGGQAAMALGAVLLLGSADHGGTASAADRIPCTRTRIGPDPGLDAYNPVPVTRFYTGHCMNCRGAKEIIPPLSFRKTAGGEHERGPNRDFGECRCGVDSKPAACRFDSLR